MKTFLAVLGCLTLLCPASAAAQVSGGATPPRLSAEEAPAPIAPQVVNRNEAGRTTVRGTRIATPLTVDGQLDEEWYRSVMPIDGFVQSEPRENEPATEKTDAWVFFDDDTLYVAARNWDSQPARMVANELRRDSSNLIQNEHFVVALDTFHDRRNGFLFMVSALGGMLEEAFVDERNPNRDWNPVWEGRAGRFDGGWSVEMAIPFKSLRYRPGSGHLWGIQLNRYIRWKNERTWVSLQPRQYGPAPHRASVAATLTGLETPPLSKNLEIKPYAIAGLTTDRTARPFPVENDRDGDVGLDVKYGVTSGLTADFTVNTDFAQVEEDEQQVNLTRFNLFFPEKREFFLEGQGIFTFGGRSVTGTSDQPILFFSRQIGLSQGRPVPIVAGGRLTGRVGDFNVGVVNIQTDDEPAARAVDTNFTAIRLRRDVLRRSTVGALFTNRSASTQGAGAAQTFGVDGLFSLYQNVRIDGYVARTQTPGRSGDDMSYRGWFDYNHDRYGANFEYLSVGANFNPEIGFLRRTDFRTAATNLRFSPRPRASRIVRKYYFNSGFSYITTGSGRLETRNATGNFRIEMQNGDNLNVDYDHNYELLEAPFRIATGVTIPVGGYSFTQSGVSYQLGSQRKVNGTLTLTSGSFYGGDQTAASYRGRIAVLPQLALEPGISFNWVDLPAGRFTTKLISTRVTAPLTPRMYASALLQFNSSANAFSSNLRFRWEYQPGSELFVVYSEGRNTLGAGFPHLDSRGFVVKVNRLFRL
jgi:hypothetical protein